MLLRMRGVVSSLSARVQLMAAVRYYQQLPLVLRRVIPQQCCHPEQAPCMPIPVLAGIITVMNTNNENIFVVTLFCIFGSADSWWRLGTILCNSWEMLLL